MTGDAYLRLVGRPEAEELSRERMEDALLALTALVASLPASDGLWTAVAAVSQALAWRLGAPSA
jgi:hypothetical protein